MTVRALRKDPGSVNPSYKDSGWAGWSGYFDWLVTKGGRLHFLSFEDARRETGVLKFKTAAEYKRWRDGEDKTQPPRQANIPKSPNTVFKRKGWTSWGHYLGTGRTTSERNKNIEWIYFNEGRE